MPRQALQCLVFISCLLFFSVALAQNNDRRGPVSIGYPVFSDDCTLLNVEGTVSGDIPYVRVQLASALNPMVLVVDEIIPVESGAFSQENIEVYGSIQNASFILMVTGWDSSAYITALQSDGVRSLYCQVSEDAEFQAVLPGLRYMRSSRQSWTNYATFSRERSVLEAESCVEFLENAETTFPQTLMQGQEEESSFPVTLRIAENGYLIRFDWQGQRFPVGDDGGVFYGQYFDTGGDGVDDEDDTYYSFDLWFTSLNTYDGYFGIDQDSSGCFWVFEWHGERSPV